MESNTSLKSSVFEFEEVGNNGDNSGFKSGNSEDNAINYMSVNHDQT